MSIIVNEDYELAKIINVSKIKCFIGLVVNKIKKEHVIEIKNQVKWINRKKEKKTSA